MDALRRFLRLVGAPRQLERPDVIAPPVPQAASPPPEAHPNLKLTYERARQKEASVANDANGVINKVAAVLAFVGILVVGLLTAIDRLAWGFVQDRSLSQAEWIFWPNVTLSLIWLTLACLTIPRLISVYRSTRILEPWGPELSQPEGVLADAPDDVLMRLLKDMDFANLANGEEVSRQQGALEKALVRLLIIAVLIVGQIGYNSAWKIARESHPEVRSHESRAAPCYPNPPALSYSNPPVLNLPKPSHSRKAGRPSRSALKGKGRLRLTRAGSASAPGAGSGSR